VLPHVSYEWLKKIKGAFDPNQVIISAHPRPAGGD
jgi:hypothetical protein